MQKGQHHAETQHNTKENIMQEGQHTMQVEKHHAGRATHHAGE